MQNDTKNKDVKIYVENGIWTFKLGTILEERKISKNKMMQDTNTKHDTL